MLWSRTLGKARDANDLLAMRYVPNWYLSAGEKEEQTYESKLKN
jgi:hypothetical protein